MAKEIMAEKNPEYRKNVKIANRTGEDGRDAEHTRDMTRKKGRIMVVGAVNMDICGKPYDPLVGADSNPGTVSLSMGGVGRNIAHNLRLLEQPVSLITVFGDDTNGEVIRSSLKALEIDLSGSVTVPGASTSSYLFITDEKGEMQLAVSDMNICEKITPQLLAGRLDQINDAVLCVADANLPEESIEFLAENLSVPLFADPVSTAKMYKLKRVLGRIHTFKPNRLEAEMLTGIPIVDENSLRLAAAALLDTGMQRVFISLGADGVFCADHSQMLLLPGICARVRSTTGGGDCFMAGLAYAYREGLSLEDSAHLALAAGAICTEGEHTINEALSLRALYERAGIS
ncbi:MAG: PfkB family carbohydrate kinase [Lachnospiraceae bacterium]|nr:PfkB family carbohydrate kinase [Lachnospiraceae bacterium]